MSQLSRFRIEGLYNARTIDLRIENNTLILVGENGTGKSTVVNLLYFFLTFQWNRISETKFRSISAVIDDKEYCLSRDDIKFIVEADYSVRRSILPRRTLSTMPADEILDLVLSISESHSPKKWEQFERSYGIPYRIIQRSFKSIGKIPENLRETIKSLRLAKEKVAEQVLYLPTYRRIEQDLEMVLPGIDIGDLKRERKKYPGTRPDPNYIELVEFGMEDVVRTIQKKTMEIEKKARTDLSNLTGEYLRDVIRGSYRTADLSQLEGTDDKTFDDILSRIPVEILQESDKAKLKEIIDEFNTTGQIAENSQVVAHFLASLIQLHQKQQADEKEIRDFISICNEGYLIGKRFGYDSKNFEVSIFHELYDTNRTPSFETLPVSALSSGEKQIVSLFSHLYLSGSPHPFVIIDEPELSLSVPWQKRFLPDIANKSNGFIAVTHSPFIYDNDLRVYTHSLEEFVEPFEFDSTLEEPSFPSEYDDIPF